MPTEKKDHQSISGDKGPWFIIKVSHLKQYWEQRTDIEL